MSNRVHGSHRLQSHQHWWFLIMQVLVLRLMMVMVVMTTRTIRIFTSLVDMM